MKDARLAKGFTQQKLAELLGLALPSINRLERGETVPRLATARAIARALDVSVEHLFPENEEVA